MTDQEHELFLRMVEMFMQDYINFETLSSRVGASLESAAKVIEIARQAKDDYKDDPVVGMTILEGIGRDGATLYKSWNNGNE
jgi:hypothetical protein